MESINKDIAYLLEVFCHVVEQKSFVKAGSVMGIQGPAISKAIIRLEKILNQRLLQRSTRVVVVTDVGQALYQESIKQLNALNNMLETITSVEQKISGIIRLSATPTVGEYLCQFVLPDFYQLHPELKVSMTLTNDMVSLPSQNIDITFRSSVRIDDSTSTSQHLFDLKRVLAASPGYLAKYSLIKNPEQLKHHACLHFSHQEPLDVWTYQRDEITSSIKTNSILSCNSYQALKEACLQSVGIARLFAFQVDEELAQGRVQHVLEDYTWGEQQIHAVYHGKVHESPKINALVSFIKSQDI
ncbi:LysR family transcriptional regulator [Thalassotalea ganghwensis]